MRLTLLTEGGQWPLDAAVGEVLTEQARYRIRLEEERDGADPEAYQLRAGGIALPLVRSQISGSRVALEWEWHPDFYAGRFAVELRYGPTRLFPTEAGAPPLEVITPAYKLAARDYEAMLADLSQWTAGWLAPAPGLKAAKAEAERSDAWLAALEYLIRHFPHLERLVEQAVERPRRGLERLYAQAPLYAVTTTGEAEAGGALARPDRWIKQDGPLPAPLDALRQRTGGWLPGALAQPRVRSTLDRPENRFLRFFLGQMRQELSDALEYLGRASGTGPAELIARRAEQARQMLRVVSRWLRSTWLAELEPPPGGAPVPTPALLMHPVYGSLWRIYLQWQRAVTLAADGDRLLPVDRTYQLYEYWCYLTVVRELAVLRGMDPDQAVAPALGRDGRQVRVLLQPGERFDLTVDGVTVSFQRSFGYGGRGFGSCSHAMRPDIAVELGDGRLLLLDPKYRVGHDGVRDGLDDMHRYRDALVNGAGERAVAGGFLLCPAMPAARRYGEVAYQARWGLGVQVLAPGEGAEGLRELLGRFVPPHLCNSSPIDTVRKKI